MQDLLAGIAVVLTVAMMALRSRMLGFPCFIFWMLLAGYEYSQSLALWDINYLVFFASFGMALFCILGMFGLREEKDTMAATDATEYIDEKGSTGEEDMDDSLIGGTEEGDEDKPRKRKAPPNRVSRAQIKRRARWW